MQRTPCSKGEMLERYHRDIKSGRRGTNLMRVVEDKYPFRCFWIYIREAIKQLILFPFRVINN